MFVHSGCIYSRCINKSFPCLKYTQVTLSHNHQRQSIQKSYSRENMIKSFSGENMIFLISKHRACLPDYGNSERPIKSPLPQINFISDTHGPYLFTFWVNSTAFTDSLEGNKQNSKFDWLVDFGLYGNPFPIWQVLWKEVCGLYLGSKTGSFSRNRPMCTHYMPLKMCTQCEKSTVSWLSENTHIFIKPLKILSWQSQIEYFRFEK